MFVVRLLCLYLLLRLLSSSLSCNLYASTTRVTAPASSLPLPLYFRAYTNCQSNFSFSIPTVSFLSPARFIHFFSSSVGLGLTPPPSLLSKSPLLTIQYVSFIFSPFVALQTSEFLSRVFHFPPLSRWAPYSDVFFYLFCSHAFGYSLEGNQSLVLLIRRRTWQQRGKIAVHLATQEISLQSVGSLGVIPQVSRPVTRSFCAHLLANA